MRERAVAVLGMTLALLAGFRAFGDPPGPTEGTVPALAEAAPKPPGPDGGDTGRDGERAPEAGPAPDSVEVGVTVIQGTRPPTPDRAQDQVVVSGEALRDSPNPNLLESLARQSAALHVTRRGVGPAGIANGAAGGITLRGLGGSPNTQVLVVEDGVPDVQGIFGHPLPDAYVPDLLEDAVLLSGGDSVLFGSNAMGGAILLRSRWLDSDGWEVLSDASLGSFMTLEGTVTALGRRGPWDGAFALHGMRTDGHRDGAGGSVLVLQTAGRHRPADSWQWTLRNKVVRVTGGDPGTLQHPFTDHTFEVWRDNLSGTLEWQRPGLRVTLLPYATMGRHRIYDGFQSLDWTLGARGEVSWRPHRDLEMWMGLQAEGVDGQVEDRLRGTSQDLDGSVEVGHYQQVVFRPVPGLCLVVGSRELYGDQTGFLWMAKAGARWQVWRGLSLRTRLARNYRRPTLRERYLPFPVANPDLGPETSWTWDMTLGFEDFRHLDVSLTAYRSQAHDLIKYFGSWPTAEVVNIDSIVVWGVEGRLVLRDLGPFGASVSGAWQKVGRYTRQNPEAKVDFTLTLGHRHGVHLLRGEVSGEWVHGLYMANYHRDRIADVFFLDLVLRYRHEDPRKDWVLEPYLVLRNLLNRRYEYLRGYAMPGFHALVGLKIGVGP